MKTKYKPGSKVRVRVDLEPNRGYKMRGSEEADVATPGMLTLAGKTVTIKEVTKWGKYHIEEMGWNWTDEMFGPLDTEPIIIYSAGDKVIALDKNTGRTGRAKCSPDDNFDFYIGADLAYARLRERAQREEMTAPSFKEGDIVVGLPNNGYSITTNGWLGLVVRVRSNNYIDLRGFRLATDEDITAEWLKKIWALEKQ